MASSPATASATLDCFVSTAIEVDKCLRTDPDGIGATGGAVMFSPPLAGRSTRLEAALALADALTPVFPCVPGDKTPLTSHGFYDATTDQDQISRWWERWPDANIAMPTGQRPGAITYDVLDVDVRPTGSGFPALRLLSDLGVLRGAVAVRATPSGGRHVLFHSTDQRSARIPEYFLDFKAVGGYVLVPPSATPDGQYRLLETASTGSTLDFDEVRRILRHQPPRRAGSRSTDRPEGPGRVRRRSRGR